MKKLLPLMFCLFTIQSIFAQNVQIVGFQFDIPQSIKNNPADLRAWFQSAVCPNFTYSLDTIPIEAIGRRGPVRTLTPISPKSFTMIEFMVCSGVRGCYAILRPSSNNLCFTNEQKTVINTFRQGQRVFVLFRYRENRTNKVYENTIMYLF